MSVCVFASLCTLCVCQLLILYKHTYTRVCARAHSHIQTMMGREAHRGGGWKNEREKEDHLQYWRTRWLLCCLLDIWLLGAKASSHFVPFRWRRPVEWHFYAVTERWFFSSSSTSSILYCPVWLSFFLSIHNNYYNSYRFLCYHMNVYVCMHLQRPWKCAMLHCNRWSIGRSSVCVREFTKGTK
jgi:hypothetical protein